MITNVLSLILFTLTIKSSNGAYIGDVVYTGGTNLQTASFKLYDQDGNMLYQILNPEAISFFISNSGVVFATNEQNLYLYKTDGQILNLKKLNYPNGFGFSPDGTIFFASDRDGMYAYSLSGSLVYQFKPGRLFASTDIAQKVAVVSNDTIVYYENGELKFQKILESPFVRSLEFFDNDKIIKIELPDKVEKIKIDDILNKGD
ncbi:MAG: hypothetical protein ABIL69_03290 [candidate division WOR-3 bacterium]